MADDKRKDFDDDKTVVEPRRPVKPEDTAKKPVEDEDRTVMMPAGGAKPSVPPEDEAEHTVLMKRPVTPAGPADEAERTMVRPSQGGASTGDQTLVRPSGAAPAAGADAGFAVICLSGPAKGQRIPIPAPDAMVGSAPGCQVTIPGAAPHHARLEQIGDTVEIQALGGPVVRRGQKIDRASLKSGDVLKIGEVVVRFVKAGEVFSSSYSEAELSGGGAPDFAALARNPKILAAAGLVVVAGLWLLMSPGSEPIVDEPTAGTDAAESRRAKEIENLVTSGEVLFNAGRLVAPPDQPEIDNAYRTFNRVLELDPGNQQALQWLERIDAELRRLAGLREEAELARRQREREAEERARLQMQERVNAILAEGDALFEKGQVVEPVGTNALVKYRAALELDPQSPEARERLRRALYYHVEKGDELRERNDLWRALENYRKASRAAGGDESEIEERVQDTEARLRSGMAGAGSNLVMYKDDRGQLFVLDEMEKVPARYRDRAVKVEAEPAGESPGNAR